MLQPLRMPSKRERSNEKFIATISPRYKICRLSSNAYQLFEKRQKAVNYYQYLIDRDKDGVFWIKLTKEKVEEGRKLTQSLRRFRNFPATTLMKYLRLVNQPTFSCEAEWDDLVGALRIDITKHID